MAYGRRSKIQFSEFTLLQFPVRLFFFGGGIPPAGGGIYPSAGGRNLDFCLCTIPTVGLYGKLGEITATHHTSSTSTEMPPPPSTTSILANHHGCRQWILQQLAMRGGKACQYFWRPGSSFKEAFAGEMTLSLPVDELYVVGGVVGFVNGGGGIEIGRDVCCHEQVITSARELLTKLPLLADAALVWTMHITFHSFCLLLLLLLLLPCASCEASPPPPHPRHHPVHPPNGTRTDAVPHPSKGGESYAPEVRDQVGRVMLGASVRPGIQINKSSRHYSSPV